MSTKGLLERLSSGEGLVVAEGYLFEFEARGHLKAGGYVPEVVIEHPELVRNLHREFVHAGSDVVLAFTYYAHREKLRLIGRERELEKINRTALKIAREVADETGTLMAGNLSNSTIYKPGDESVLGEIREMFTEQVKWAVEGGADFIVAETIDTYTEAKLALDAIQEHGNGLPAVITLSVRKDGLADNRPLVEAVNQLHKDGAAVVGFNCTRGPATMLELLKQVAPDCKVPLAALPVCYRTNCEQQEFQGLLDIDDPSQTAFPVDLDAHLVSRTQIAEFSRAAWGLGVRYLGLCCGNRSHYLRTMAESVGRTPAASRYSPDMSAHYSRMKDERYSFTQGVFEERYLTNDRIEPINHHSG